ncbi:MMPL family transporter [Nocardioides mangrovicus]|uniref:MMPL family transporter n=2 Tax=Nocardioides mangrovicus TaxID=2478913 RepID=A0A3L8P0P6_9ACTN|nr:MMPL family transporter [Nocardioides mangrovicus]
MVRLTAWVLRHRWWVALFWAAVAVAGGVTAPTTADRLSFSFDLPGQPAFETNQAITKTFGTAGVDDPLLVVVRGGDATTSAEDLARRLQQGVPGTRVVTAADASHLTTADGRASVVVVYPRVSGGPEPYAATQPRLEKVVTAARSEGVDARLTGFELLSEGGSSGGSRSVLAEVVLGAAGALVVLVLVFASLLAGVPLLVAAVSILGTFLALLGLTVLTDVSAVVEYLVALVGLGVAIDYSLLVVTRWREERSAGLDNDEAVAAAMATAGRSVLFSGVTVAVSLAALVLVPLPFLRSIGLGGLLIPLLSVATTLTLVPVLLSAVGPALTWPRRQATVGPSRFWGRVAAGVLRARWLTIAGCVVVLLVLAAPVLGLRLGSAQLSGVIGDSASARAVSAAVSGGVPVGVVRPVQVLTEGSAVALATRLREVDGVAAVAAPTTWSEGDQRLLQVYLRADPASSAGRAALDRVRSTASRLDARVGGSPAEDADFVTAVYDDIGWVVLAVVVVTFLLLARALRSLWLPVKALVLNALSIAAAYGITVWIWQGGHGTDLLFGQPAAGAVTTWVPIAAFAFLFGLSMDYEVFILSRMRESYDRHGDTPRAVVDGIAHTGRLVTSAALILFLAFIALSTVPSVDVKILATALALGILIDAVVVRSLLAPALVGVLGRANWTMPRWLRAVLRARPVPEPGHAAGPE